ncbi:serine hydrolase domain-containing protein [Salinibacter grassmerensis]|uniref:serine hydrolase domain-containing protein n=1 Tax=Salinibacter grassmerensis TaxID=3040353 RepID=UPI0021E7820C|nr:serine hydrolase [Salinibacter grassmerensis]
MSFCSATSRSALCWPLAPSALGGLLLLCLVAAPAHAQSGPTTETWRAHPPKSYGFDAFALATAVDRAADLAPPLTSLLVARGSTTVAEVYFNGRSPAQGANLKSASKSVLSALTGIAVEDGILDGVEQPIGPFFPTLLADAPRKQRITIDHLLTQQTGLESTSFGNYGAWVSSPDWVADALRRPMVDRPGGDMIYSTGTTHILGAVLAEASGRSLRSFAQDRLFDPLGVRVQSWQRAPTGRYFGGNNMALTPRAMLRFGQLYLNDGRFRGQQVLPADWVDLSWRTYVRSTYRDHQYGYLWFTHELGGERVAFAWGYGGQYVFVVPRLDLVMACTSSLRDRPRGSEDHNEQIMRLLAENIIPAAQGPLGPSEWPPLPQPVFGW